MRIKSKEEVLDYFELDVLFLKDKEYEFIKVDNRFTRVNGFCGYSIDEGKYKRWITPEFFNKYFEVV